MEFQLLPIFTFLFLALVASHAAVSPEAYWNSVLPNTPMPMAVKDLLHSGGGNFNEWKVMSRIHTDSQKAYQQAYGDSVDHLLDNTNEALFFLEKDMKQGRKMNLQFTKSSNAATFLPRQVAEKIPFSSDKLPEILNHFSLKPNSVEAETMKKSIKECEETGIKGEEKYCATSLESMIDFSISKLGKNVRAISTEEEKETKLQQYSIEGVKKMASDETVVCHKQDCPFAVFYCHKFHSTSAYMVSMAGADGTKAKAVAVCHKDTSAWNPKHLAFQVLKVKPGTVPICHFLTEDQIVWIPN